MNRQDAKNGSSELTAEAQRKAALRNAGAGQRIRPVGVEYQTGQRIALYPPLAYNNMIFVESPQFTRAIAELIDEDEYRLLQAALLENPEAGAIIVGSRGLRKIRWSLPGRGKRGGARLIYYYWVVKSRIYLLYAYSKSAKGDLTRDQIRILAGLVQKEVRDG